MAGACISICLSRNDQDFVRGLHVALNARGNDTRVDWESIPLTAECVANRYAELDGPDTVEEW
jgi:hypothetical protein